MIDITLAEVFGGEPLHIFSRSRSRHLDIPQFLFSDMLTAIGIEQANLKSWLSRGVVRLGEFDREAGGSGRRHILTLRTVYEFAITAHLVRMGILPAAAFVCATYFSQRVSGKRVDKRNPDTLLFDQGQTIMAMGAGKNWDDRVEVVQIIGNGGRVIFDLLSRRVAVVMVDCNAIIGGVDRALGYTVG